MTGFLSMLSDWADLISSAPRYEPNVRNPQPASVVTEKRDPLPRGHHPRLDNTAITVRRVHMDFTQRGLCYCCEAGSKDWLCGECQARGCGERP